MQQDGRFPPFTEEMSDTVPFTPAQLRTKQGANVRRTKGHRRMPKKLRVLTNRRPNADPSVQPFPVTESVEWVYTEFHDNKAPSEALVDADVYIGTDFTKEMGAAANSLKAILIAAAGYDRIDPDAVPVGCIVANAYHHEAPIAEWVMAVAVALDHELFKSERTFRSGSWEMWPGRHGIYRELMGRTFGIVGFGAIGRRVARLAQAYEMPVIAAGRADKAEGELYGANYIGGGTSAREHVLSEADFVLISTPLGPATQGFIGAHELGLMKPTAYIINPARGHIIDETALYNALKNRTIAGAAIDTWYQYPESATDAPRPSDHPFWELNNIIMVPHHSGATYGTATRRAQTVAQNLDHLTRGEPLINIVEEISR